MEQDSFDVRCSCGQLLLQLHRDERDSSGVVGCGCGREWHVTWTTATGALSVMEMPRGTWGAVGSADTHLLKRDALDALRALSDDDRSDVMAHFCRGCGREDPRCQCENDE